MRVRVLLLFYNVIDAALLASFVLTCRYKHILFMVALAS